MITKKAELAIIYRAIYFASEGAELFKSSSYTVELFSPKFRPALEILKEFYDKYNKPPSLKVINKLIKNNIEQYQQFLIEFSPKDAKKFTEHPFIYLDKIIVQYKRNNLGRLLLELQAENVDDVTEDNVDLKINQLFEEIATLKDVELTADRRPKSAATYAEEVISEYKQSKDKDKYGIPLPFQHLSDIIGVLEPGTMSAVLGRTGIGKTWWIILLLLSTLRRKKKVLIVSMEMSITMLLRRIWGVASKTPYNKLVDGGLTKEEEDNFYKVCRAFKHNENLLHLPSRAVRNPYNLYNIVKDCKADLVIIDAFYLINEVEGDRRDLKIQNILGAFKAVATELKPTIVLTSQFNKNAVSRTSANEFSVAFSDAINHDCDYRFDLYQSASMQRHRQIVMKVGKARERGTGVPGRYWWDVTTMKFDFINLEIEAAGAEDEEE